MKEETVQSVAAPENRKAYHAPALVEFGEVNELTRTSLPVTYLEPNDGGSFPNSYTSQT